MTTKFIQSFSQITLNSRSLLALLTLSDLHSNLKQYNVLPTDSFHHSIDRSYNQL